MIGIEGAGYCGLDFLGRAASVTSGSINIAAPLELVRQVRAIYQVRSSFSYHPMLFLICPFAQNTIIATDVSITVLLHKALAFRAETLLEANAAAAPSAAPASKEKKAVAPAPAAGAASVHSRLEKVIGNVTQDSVCFTRYCAAATWLISI